MNSTVGADLSAGAIVGIASGVVSAIFLGIIGVLKIINFSCRDNNCSCVCDPNKATPPA